MFADDVRTVYKVNKVTEKLQRRNPRWASPKASLSTHASLLIRFQVSNPTKSDVMLIFTETLSAFLLTLSFDAVNPRRLSLDWRLSNSNKIPPFNGFPPPSRSYLLPPRPILKLSVAVGNLKLKIMNWKVLNSIAPLDFISFTPGASSLHRSETLKWTNKWSNSNSSMPSLHPPCRHVVIQNFSWKLNFKSFFSRSREKFNKKSFSRHNLQTWGESTNTTECWFKFAYREELKGRA